MQANSLFGRQQTETNLDSLDSHAVRDVSQNWHVCWQNITPVCHFAGIQSVLGLCVIGSTGSHRNPIRLVLPLRSPGQKAGASDFLGLVLSGVFGKLCGTSRPHSV